MGRRHRARPGASAMAPLAARQALRVRRARWLADDPQIRIGARSSEPAERLCVGDDVEFAPVFGFGQPENEGPVALVEITGRFLMAAIRCEAKLEAGHCLRAFRPMIDLLLTEFPFELRGNYAAGTKGAPELTFSYSSTLAARHRAPCARCNWGPAPACTVRGPFLSNWESRCVRRAGRPVAARRRARPGRHGRQRVRNCSRTAAPACARSRRIPPDRPTSNADRGSRCRRPER